MSDGEDQITEWFARQRKLPQEQFPIGIGDDMAELRLAEGVSVLVTTDMLLDGAHFDLSEVTLEQAGYKAIAASLSDCAAMATKPVAAVVSVALPAGFGEAELKELHKGIVACADKFNCALIGGDITTWKRKERFAISVAMLSKPGGITPIRRSGAKVDDVICVTGSLGGSQFGKHLVFEPRVNEALKLAGLVNLHSMIDISDGLSSDLNRICRQSGVGAMIDAEKVPISDEAKKTGDPLASALNDGEDFELLFTLDKREFEKLQPKWNEKLTVTAIGRTTSALGMQIKMTDGQVQELQVHGYNHLRG